MTCPGLHCPGCSSCSGGGWLVRLAALVFAVIEIAEFIAARIWWILGGTAVAIAVPVYIVWRLTRWQQHREAVHAVQRPFVTEREAPAAVPSAARRELGSATVINVNIFTADAEESAARIIRQALPGHAGDETAEEESA
jgi:hypothetical protein